MAWGIAELWVFVLSIIWLGQYFRGRVDPGPVLRGAWPVLLCLALWLAYVWLQRLPLPIAWLAAISPETARAHALAAHPETPALAPLMLDLHGGLHAALKSTAYVLFFFLTLALLETRQRIRIAAYTLVISGLMQAVYGGVAALEMPGESAHGTFVNRNHFAGYLEMCLAVGLGMLIANLTGRKAHNLRQFLRDAAELILGPRMRLRLALVCMVIGLVLSRSRMGNTAFFSSLLVAGVIGLAFSRRATRSMVILITSLIVIDVVIVGSYFGASQVVERIEKTTLATEDRPDVAARTLEMWQAFPVFGSGLGSYHVVYPRFTGPEVPISPTHAHNDYLQFLAETGGVGILLLGSVVGLSLFAALRAQYLRGDPLARGLAFGAVMGISTIMIHSSTDFNLQIPSNAMTFMFVLALGWIALNFERREHSSSRDRRNDDAG
ncbi:O-antigen ligase family protein [Sulfuritalea sp.]|uniref:O-antigen ligase family protein n=1 Tax=Sulfuritalea sp. TaxID=2480090 RepID=UPI00286E9C76|nr:O-antigen ligase family protein [Sulfuritalea sp.]